MLRGRLHTVTSRTSQRVTDFNGRDEAAALGASPVLRLCV